MAGKPRLLKRGQRIYVKHGPFRYGVVSGDEIPGDFRVMYYLEGDDPAAIDYGKRVALRLEISPIIETAPLITLGDHLKAALK